MSTRPAAALRDLARSFGPDAARRKVALLDELAAAPRLAPSDLRTLNDTLGFLRAYPDNAAVRARADALAASLRDRIGPHRDSLSDTGFPGSYQCYEYSYGNLVQLAARFTGALDVAWDVFDDTNALHNALVLVLTPAEVQGLDDIRLSLEEWVARAKPAGITDLEFLLDVFRRSRLSCDEAAYIFDACGVPARYDLARPGTGRAELAVPAERIRYQRRPMRKERAPLAGVIREPLRTRRGSRRLLDLSLAALACRNLEIAPLIYANPDDIVVAACGRGLEIALIGTVPEQRDPLESSYFALFLKNGVPIAYGPASVCLGCSEQGVNLFPEFRGAEMRHIIGQFYRVLHHVLGARNFFLTTYAMGEDNPAALATGAFWFYRKMGFAALNPAVEALARAEEERMRADPAYRSDRAMLRRLSHTEACFDLSAGACTRFDFAAFGLRVSSAVAGEFGGDRARAETRWTARAARDLGVVDRRLWSEGERRALRILAPVFCAVGDVGRWSAREKAALVRLVRAKGGRSETACDRMLQRHARLREALRALADG